MTHTSFLGIPVDGEILSVRRTPQRPLAELQPLLTALLDDTEIVEFGWRQFTPYFADGDPCVFGIGGFWVRTGHDDPELPIDDLGIGAYADEHPTLGRGGRIWSGSAELTYQGDDEERYRRCRALADALESDAFNEVLLTAFGDHASVTVRYTGIVVDSYDHD